MDTARVKQYFERIGLPMPQKIVPNAELLQQLTFHQIISIPFENTQLLIKKMVPCDVDSLFQRIVIEGKGGICHDIASLFGWFLTELGYQVIPVGAIAFDKDRPMYIHKTLVVTDCNGGKWLVEVAHALVAANKLPFRFVPGEDQVRGDEVFRIEERENKTCLIGPDDYSSFTMEYWDIPMRLGTRIKENTIQGLDPLGQPDRVFGIGTPEGRRTLIGNTYRESFGDQVYTLECTRETLPWAYAQFGLRYEDYAGDTD